MSEKWFSYSLEPQDTTSLSSKVTLPPTYNNDVCVYFFTVIITYKILFYFRNNLLDSNNRTCIMGDMTKYTAKVINLETYISYNHRRLTEKQKHHVIYILDFFRKVRYYYISNTNVL